MTRVAVLGSTGMLGSMLVPALSDEPGIEVTPVSRAGATSFDATRDDPAALLDRLGCDWVLNAIGVLRSNIDEGDPGAVAAALAVNRDFPHRLAGATATHGSRLIHFSTDAVFGGRGPHAERAPHEGRGPYARSKSEGEPESDPALTLRCSIIGPEGEPARSLLGWALGQETGATIDGYTDVRWNGVTSWHLARLCAAIIGGRAAVPSPMHVVPADSVSKARLLQLVLSEFGRDDVTVRPVESGSPSETTLCTSHPEENRALWQAAGWAEPPTVAAMVAELARVESSATRGG